MAVVTENYGVFAQLAPSEASTPVSTDTNLIFIGASPSGTVNEPVIITSMSDYANKLGGAAGDGYNLSEAAVACFQIAGLAKAYFIPVSNSKIFNADDYIGVASHLSGVYAIENLLRQAPTAVNLICAPSVSDGEVIAAIKGICQLADGHWQSYFVYDLPQSMDQIPGGYGIPYLQQIYDDKTISTEYGSAVWGNCKTSGGYSVSGAAVRAALMAKSDASYGVPARVGGNLAVEGITGIVLNYDGHSVTNSASIGLDHKVKFVITESGYTSYSGLAFIVYIMSVTGGTTVSKSETIEFENGQGTATFDTSTLDSPSITSHTVILPVERKVNLTEADATSLSANGICSWINYGGGSWHTWGDHTSAFSNGSISEERGRFENTIRMNQMISNRFQLKYRFEIDDPMTLGMRNAVINEQLDFLNGLVAIGALIGEPVVEFRPADNPVDNVAQGRFCWYTADTPTIPAKYMLNKVAYTQAGLSVYYTEE